MSLASLETSQPSVLLTWLGIVACIGHSAMFSGLNLAFFGLSRLNLEVAAEGGSAEAKQVLALRQDSNLLLTTILWGNVAANVLLTMLTDSVMAGTYAFFFSTFGITFLGEIVPQAWFSRNALRMGSALAPVVRGYQRLLWPFAKPSAWLLDRWLGPEGRTYLLEHDLKRVISKHMEAEEADLAEQEGRGALNFLALDDLPLGEVGEPVDPRSVICLPVQVDLPILPEFEASPEDPFVARVHESGHKWVILCSLERVPLLVLDADDFLRNLFMRSEGFDAYACCHRPVVIRNPTTAVGQALRELRVHRSSPSDDVIDHDLILLWAEGAERVLTGADLLGFLLRGIVPALVDESALVPDDAGPPPPPEAGDSSGTAAADIAAPTG